MPAKGVFTASAFARGPETDGAFGAQCMANCLATYLFFGTWLAPLLFEELLLFLDLLSFLGLPVASLSSSPAVAAARSWESTPFSRPRSYSRAILSSWGDPPAQELLLAEEEILCASRTGS